MTQTITYTTYIQMANATTKQTRTQSINNVYKLKIVPKKWRRKKEKTEEKKQKRKKNIDSATGTVVLFQSKATSIIVQWYKTIFNIHNTSWLQLLWEQSNLLSLTWVWYWCYWCLYNLVTVFFHICCSMLLTIQLLWVFCKFPFWFCCMYFQLMNCPFI